MSTLVLILGMAVGVYALRLGGLLLAGARVPPTWERALGFVPVATLTALVMTSLLGRPEEGPTRLIAAFAGGFASWWTGRAWVCILVGMVVYWLLRLV